MKSSSMINREVESVATGKSKSYQPGSRIRNNREVESYTSIHREKLKEKTVKALALNLPSVHPNYHLSENREYQYPDHLPNLPP